MSRFDQSTKLFLKARPSLLQAPTTALPPPRPTTPPMGHNKPPTRLLEPTSRLRLWKAVAFHNRKALKRWPVAGVEIDGKVVNGRESLNDFLNGKDGPESWVEYYEKILGL